MNTDRYSNVLITPTSKVLAEVLKQIFSALILLQSHDPVHF